MLGNQWVWGLHLLFFGIVLVATSYTCLAAQNLTTSCHERERLALLEFKHSVKDDFNMLSSWVGFGCCSWKGVLCDGATGNIISLHLKGNNNRPLDHYFDEDSYLVGDTVNTFMAELKFLKHLDLSGNNFQGSWIPKSIGSFKQLRYLNLSNADFSGIIPPQIGNLSNLKVLDLSSSSVKQILQSHDMAWVSGLSSLQHLDLGQVELFQAKHITMVLYMIPSLTYLSLRGCRLSNVDLSLHLNSSKILPNIEHLDLSLNFFQGQLPHFFQNITSLTFLDLSSYNLSLSWNSVKLLNTIPSLSELYLSRCGLHSAHFSPRYFNFSAHSNILHLDLSGNSIEGRFPSQLKNMTTLRVLNLSGNRLNSSIPVMPNLLKLYVSEINIELVGMWRQCHLKTLSVSGNYFGEEMIGRSTNMSECSQYALEELDLHGNKLKGSIPESLGRLTNLRVLDLTSNNLTGSIPKALERLRSLQVISLANNDLSGTIPTFLGKVTKLYLLWNQFSGSIPESLGRLTGLTELVLDFNKLTGPIPTSLGRLSSLKKFTVSFNMINGTIPVSIGQLTKLFLLDVSYNSLEGVVLEDHFAKLSMLKVLYTTSNYKLMFNISHECIPPFQLISLGLGSTKIGDEFPQWLRTQGKLEYLVLSNASLQGLLPTWLQKMPVISYLDLSHNKLSGSLINLPFRNPISRYELEDHHEFLLLQDNLFNVPIPRTLCRRTSLVLLDVSKNRLSGNIPDCVENLQRMVMLILSSNWLSGVLPSSLGNISSSLEWLQLNDNLFTGELPQGFGNLRLLRVLDLGNNKLTGNIPRWVGKKLTTLRVLRLHKNNFTGRIPKSLCKCSYLHILDVAHNNLKGSIPHCFGELKGMIEMIQQGTFTPRYGIMSDVTNVIQVLKGRSLEYTKTVNLVFNMDLSSNQLVGEIPLEITALTLLVGLNLSHNHLNGSIPYSIGNMKALTSLDFSYNQLTGMIPLKIAALNFLSSLNLSHNNLSGRIPTGNQLQTLDDPSIYAGNMYLCGAPLPINCSNHETFQLQQARTNMKMVMSQKIYGFTWT